LGVRWIGDATRALRAATAIVLFVAVGVTSGATRVAADEDSRLQSYVDSLEEHGAEPIHFVLDRLDGHDLLIFDDALHTSVEPFEFYQALVRTPAFADRVQYVFLELIPINRQPDLDAYFATPEENRELLYPAFQDATSFGFPYRTYFDLLHAIYEVNSTRLEGERIQVVGVSSPSYWSQIVTAQDLKLFRTSMLSRDNSMYQIILSHMDNFESGLKGVFLTNTRHAYKGIRKSNGQYYWNTGTFFHQWHAGRTYSIRFHSACLLIERARRADASTGTTTQGLEKKVYRWARVGQGIWDSAFAAAENRPIAVPLVGTPFGGDVYIGNHMLDMAPNQTMADAYDAVVFLAPLEELRQTAIVDEIYTEQFKQELVRRYTIHFTPEQLQQRMEKGGVRTLRELIDKTHVAEPAELLPQAADVGSPDAWREAR
jgi:hypothetical protein